MKKEVIASKVEKVYKKEKDKLELKGLINNLKMQENISE